MLHAVHVTYHHCARLRVQCDYWCNQVKFWDIVSVVAYANLLPDLIIRRIMKTNLYSRNLSNESIHFGKWVNGGLILLHSDIFSYRYSDVIGCRVMVSQITHDSTVCLNGWSANKENIYSFIIILWCGYCSSDMWIPHTKGQGPVSI